MLRDLFLRLWHDEAGSVIATEYLMLGSIVGLGGAAGLTQMRDSVNAEYAELGQSVRGLNQSYGYHGTRSGLAHVGGTNVVNVPAPPSGYSYVPAQQTTVSVPVFAAP